MKKLKVFFLALITSAILLFSILSGSISYLLVIAAIFCIYYIGTYWILEFDINRIGLATLLLFPAVAEVIIGSTILVYFPKVLQFLSIYPLVFKYGIFVVGVGVVCLLSSYAVIISMNIFNVSRYKRLPLLQAAQTIIYITSVIMGYMAFNLVHHFFYTTWYSLFVLYLLIAGFLMFINNWSIKYSLRENFFYIGIGLFIFAQFVFIFLFFPLASYTLPIVLTTILYIYNGIMTYIYRRNLLQKVTYEYVVIFIIMLGLIFITSRWGVAGNLFGL